uniref:Uncharacterized protein n=1 Tax=Quercus lobata TaxID=97700 RepID=A0A7N2LKE2_QUELO
MMPLHSAIASARLKSNIAIDSSCWSWLSQEWYTFDMRRTRNPLECMVGLTSRPIHTIYSPCKQPSFWSGCSQTAHCFFHWPMCVEHWLHQRKLSFSLVAEEIVRNKVKNTS